MAKKKPFGRPPKEFPKYLQEIILNLTRDGLPDHRIGLTVGMDKKTWFAFARRNKTFSNQLYKAKEEGRGKWAGVVMGAIAVQIAKGHPWWCKLAIHNKLVPGFCDPDVNAAIKIKRAREAPKDNGYAGFIEPHPALASVTLPPGAIPFMEDPGTVQSGPSGAAVGKDGSSEAIPADGSVGNAGGGPPVG